MHTHTCTPPPHAAHTTTPPSRTRTCAVPLALAGELDRFGFESYLGLPDTSPNQPVDMHSQMEGRLGLASGTKPLARGMF